MYSSDVWGLVEMEGWPVRHRFSAVGLFIKTDSVTATECGFRRQFQRQIRLQLQSVVSIDSFKDLQYFAVVGIEMASRRITEGR